jgi:hypothetical protein
MAQVFFGLANRSSTVAGTPDGERACCALNAG